MVDLDAPPPQAMPPPRAPLSPSIEELFQARTPVTIPRAAPPTLSGHGRLQPPVLTLPLSIYMAGTRSWELVDFHCELSMDPFVHHLEGSMVTLQQLIPFHPVPRLFPAQVDSGSRMYLVLVARFLISWLACQRMMCVLIQVFRSWMWIQLRAMELVQHKPMRPPLLVDSASRSSKVHKNLECEPISDTVIPALEDSLNPADLVVSEEVDSEEDHGDDEYSDDEDDASGSGRDEDVNQEISVGYCSARDVTFIRRDLVKTIHNSIFYELGAVDVVMNNDKSIL